MSELDFTNDIGMEMVWCPPGTFEMGSPISDLRHSDHAQHEVNLESGFWIGRHPVTQEQWENLMGNNPSNFKWIGPLAPVETVSWRDAIDFCTKLSEREGGEYALPTETQWEYACRAARPGPYGLPGERYWEWDSMAQVTRYNSCELDEKMDQMGWYCENSGRQTHPVGLKSPNPWGIYDMHGNVCEWCLEFLGNGIPGFDWSEGGRGSYRVLRGGDWNCSAYDCRSADRSGIEPEFRGSGIGFRPVHTKD